MAYTYELGVIESNEHGDGEGVFVAENSNDMRRLVDRINELTAENAKLRERLADYENREGACCPEDVGFDEHIKILREQLAEAVGLLYEAFHDGYQGVPMDDAEWLANAYQLLKTNGSTGITLEWYERKHNAD